MQIGLSVGRGLAPAVNLHRTPRRGQAPALPCKLYFLRVGNGLDRSAKLHQNLRAGVETRPYNGAPRTPTPTLKLHFYFALLEILRFAQDDKLGVVGINLCGRAG